MSKLFPVCGLVAVLLNATLAGQAAATLVLYEPFADATANGGTTYATGAAVTGANSPAAASGQNNGPLIPPAGPGGAKWFAAGPTGANNTIASGNLSVPGLAASSGGKMEYGVSSGPSGRLSFPTGVSFNTGTLYYSFALSVADLGALGTSGGFSVGFNNTGPAAQTGTPSVVSTVLMMRSVGSAATGNFNLGVRKQTGAPTWSSTIFSVTDTAPIFVVGSYTFNAGTNDDVTKMWLNPSSSTFGGLTPADDLVNGPVENPGQVDIANIASLVFFRRVTAANQPADMFSDEIRVGTTWADVTPTAVPEAGPVVLWGITGIIGATIVGVRRYWKNREMGRLAA